MAKTTCYEPTNWVILLLTSIFLGMLGVDRFVMRHHWLGAAKLLTFGGIGVWWLIDIFLISAKHHFKNLVWIHY